MTKGILQLQGMVVYIWNHYFVLIFNFCSFEGLLRLGTDFRLRIYFERIQFGRKELRLFQ